MVTSRQILGASLVAQMVKNLAVMQETHVGSLGWEEPLEKGMAIHSSILVWRKAWWAIVHGGCKESDTTEQLTHIHTQTHTHIHTHML